MENISGTGGEPGAQRTTERERSAIQRISLLQSYKKSTQSLCLVLCQSLSLWKRDIHKVGRKGTGDDCILFCLSHTYTEPLITLKSSFYSSK